MIIIIIQKNQCKGRNWGPGGILQVIKRKQDLPSLLLDLKKEKYKSLATAAPGPSGTMCPVAGLEVGRGEGHLASSFK